MVLSTRANVRLWGSLIGAVAWDTDREVGVFQYDPRFVESQIQIAPFELPLRGGPMDFPNLPRGTFKGLPGLLADSLPDKFGNLLIDRWLAEQGRSAKEFNPVERLCYTGRRGMGALEFEPESGPARRRGRAIEIPPLVELANRVVSQREGMSGTLTGTDDRQALENILMIGTSAGGARAKAVLAWNETTGEFNSGQLDAPPGFTQWLLKFDGIDENKDKELADPKRFGRLEYAFYLMARAAGVDMMPCRLHEEGGRAHFMTRRFDRPDDGEKFHMQSLGAMRHFDFNQPRAFSYEQAIETINRLGIGHGAREEQVRRAFLNVVIRNQDDHVKNIAFLMNKAGDWSLSPAFDVCYAYNPKGIWTSEHQMSLSGKTDNFAVEDLVRLGSFADLKPKKTLAILDDVFAAAARWNEFSDEAGVPDSLVCQAQNGFRLELRR